MFCASLLTDIAVTEGPFFGHALKYLKQIFVKNSSAYKKVIVFASFLIFCNVQL